MKTRLHLFQGVGVELEYMIVDSDTLDVLPASDRVLHAVAGSYESEVEVGPLRWSNELVLHVLEFKTNGPARGLEGLASIFTDHVNRVNALLEPAGGRLMPSAMHPWMDPLRETRLWPHESSPIYEAYDRIFGCTGHGWSNLQSLHLNLPFHGDDEFGRLHAAIRLLLPILPALAASSPVVEGQPTGLLDTRLEVYRHNQRVVPSIAGRIIPEPVYTRRAYRDVIFRKIYRDIEPHDPEGILRYEWLNSRGAIARFERSAIEIRVLDVQETALADLSLAAAVLGVLRALVEERWVSQEVQRAWPVEPLAAILTETIRDGEAASIENGNYLQTLGFHGSRCRASELWRHLVERGLAPGDLPPELERPLHHILTRGTLARRIVQELGENPPVERIREVYAELCECLARGNLFGA